MLMARQAIRWTGRQEPQRGQRSTTKPETPSTTLGDRRQEGISYRVLFLLVRGQCRLRPKMSSLSQRTRRFSPSGISTTTLYLSPEEVLRDTGFALGILFRGGETMCWASLPPSKQKTRKNPKKIVRPVGKCIQ